MEINQQICTQPTSCIEDNDEMHLTHILNNIEIWEKYQYHQQIIQKKLTQTTAILQNENLQYFSLNIKSPGTYFAGLEENYSIDLSLNNSSKYQEKTILDEELLIHLNMHYHRMSSIYDMNNIVLLVFHLLKQKLVRTDNESLEVLTSLIVFEMENLSKNRTPHLKISQEMFSLDNPHSKWTSSININVQFIDHHSIHFHQYYH